MSDEKTRKMMEDGVKAKIIENIIKLDDVIKLLDSHPQVTVVTNFALFLLELFDRYERLDSAEVLVDTMDLLFDISGYGYESILILLYSEYVDKEWLY